MIGFWEEKSEWRRGRGDDHSWSRSDLAGKGLWWVKTWRVPVSEHRYCADGLSAWESPPRGLNPKKQIELTIFRDFGLIIFAKYSNGMPCKEECPLEQIRIDHMANFFGPIRVGSD